MAIGQFSVSPDNVSAKVYLLSNKLLSASKARLSELSLIQFIPLQTLRKRRTKWKKINNRGDTVEQAYGVNFTNPLDQSSNVPAQFGAISFTNKSVPNFTSTRNLKFRPTFAL